MTPGGSIHFPPFRLDSIEEQLWRGKQKLILQRRPFAVLSYLLRHPGNLITKEELITKVWQGTTVTDETLKVCVEKIRKALHDDPQAPRFVETVRGRGYRFIGRVVSSPYAAGNSRDQSRVRGPRVELENAQSTIRNRQSAVNVVGRETELAQLHTLLEKALNGQRQVVFITGEPGIGKTTLVKHFLSQLADVPQALLALGECTEHHGIGEPYQPIMEALERLCHWSEYRSLFPRLRQHAPLWLAQMPALLNPKQRTALQKEMRGASRKRMQREFANFVEALTVTTNALEAPLLVLCVEDLHWSDPSTLDLLVTLARRPEPARLLLIATYRPIEVLSINHPLRTVQPELQARQQCTELRLAGLSETAIEKYLAQRFVAERQQSTSTQRLAQILYQRTEGNPFLLVTLVDDLVTRGVIAHNQGQWTFPNKSDVVKAGVPTDLRQFIEKYLDQLAFEDQEILLAASVAGGTFSAALVASALTRDESIVDQRCAALVQRQQFLQPTGVGVHPDQRRMDRFTFRHALSREVCLERLTTGQRRQFHQRIGVWKEGAYGSRGATFAAELALHFDHGCDPQRAVQYYQQAAENAVRRYASQEAVTHLRRALELLPEVPDTPQHIHTTWRDSSPSAWNPVEELTF